MKLDGRHYTLVAWCGVPLIVVYLVLSLNSGRWSHALLVGAFLAFSIGYLSLKPPLPSVLDVVVVGIILANVIGWGGLVLKRVWFFDDLLHLCTSLGAALLICLRLGQSVGPPLLQRPLLLWLLSASLTLSLGVFWELFEWYVNSFQRLEDTLPDLLFNTLGALLGSALALWLMHHHPPERWRRRAAG